MCGLIILELDDIFSHERVPLNKHMKLSGRFLAVGHLVAPQQMFCSISLMLDLPSFALYSGNTVLSRIAISCLK